MSRGGILSRCSTGWTSFCYLLPAEYSSAILRIASALAMLMASQDAIPRDYAQFLSMRNPELYHPLGILTLLGTSVPNVWLLTVIKAVFYASTAFVLVGFLGRLSIWISCLSSLVLIGFYDGFLLRGWSHSYTVLLLAQIAFLFARSTQVLSVDSIIRRWNGTRQRKAPFWPIWLVQFVVTVMFANAAYYKFREGGYTFAWALSDNLRNMLVIHYQNLGLDLPVVLEWLVSRPSAYRALALLNMFCQFLPALVLCFPKRAGWRAVAGLLFVIEVVSISLVMRFHILKWLCLAVIFIDWDRIVARWRSTTVESPVPENAENLSVATPLARKVWGLFVFVFCGFYLFVSFVYGKPLNSYPFGPFQMFSSIRDSSPFGTSKPYHFNLVHFKVDLGPDREVQARKIERRFAWWFPHLPSSLAASQLESVSEAVRSKLRGEGLERLTRAVRIYDSKMVVPPYPQRPVPQRISQELIADVELFFPEAPGDKK